MAIAFVAKIRRQGGAMKLRLENVYGDLVAYDIANNSYKVILTTDQGRSAIIDLRQRAVFVGALWLLVQQHGPVNPLGWRPDEMLPEDYYAG